MKLIQMDLGEALVIVHELAKQNALDPKTCDRELQEEAERQRLALATVEDFIVNEFGED